MSDQWQPIETAPKDGTAVLVYGNGEKTFAITPKMGVRYWQGRRWEEPNASGHDVDDWLDGQEPYSPVTHWMPLPEPPSVKD